MSHSPEPWAVCGCDGSKVCRIPTIDFKHDTVAVTQNPADAERIVACVNACKGIPTEALQDAGYALIVGMGAACGIAHALMRHGLALTPAEQPQPAANKDPS